MTDNEMFQLCLEAFDAIAKQYSIKFMIEKDWQYRTGGKTISQQLASRIYTELNDHIEGRKQC